jgi:hypothetical protein
MLRKFITGRVMIPIILCLQILPLLLFPASSFSITSQELWLPLLLSLLTVIALVQLLLRKNLAAWPWYLLAFSQGFNIISRMMTLFPHATVSGQDGELQANGSYVLVAIVAMLLSAFEIWYGDLPEVRQKLASRSATPKTA